MNETKGVLWDVDGTLVDSAEYHWLSWRETLAREKFELSRERFDRSFGQRNDEILRDYFGPEIAASEVARISLAKEQGYRALLGAGGIEPLPGVRRWLEQLRADHWRQA